MLTCCCGSQMRGAADRSSPARDSFEPPVKGARRVAQAGAIPRIALSAFISICGRSPLTAEPRAQILQRRRLMAQMPFHDDLAFRVPVPGRHRNPSSFMPTSPPLKTHEPSTHPAPD